MLLGGSIRDGVEDMSRCRGENKEKKGDMHVVSATEGDRKQSKVETSDPL